jgi:hypothetical protein
VLYTCRWRIDHIKNVQERRALPYQVSVWDLEKLISIAREARHVLVFVFSLIPFEFFLFSCLWAFQLFLTFFEMIFKFSLCSDCNEF